jgi:hypothetical protein
MVKSPSAIELVHDPKRPVSNAPILKYVFENELVQHGYNEHKAGWWFWDDDYGPAWRVVFDDEQSALDAMIRWIENFR